MSQVLVIGLVEGTLFGLLAVGITLIHRGTGAINFALGEVGTFGTGGGGPVGRRSTSWMSDSAAWTATRPQPWWPTP